MIEIVYKDQKNSEEKNKASISLPKNIRQIGLPSEKKKIYMEDYVMSFLNQLAGKSDSPFHTAVLLGYIKRSDKGTHIFVSGAVEVAEPLMEIPHKINFTEDVWTSIYGTVKKYFDSLEIIGWFYSMPGFSSGITDEMHRIHRENFSGNDKVFFLVDSLEKEESVFSFEGGKLDKQNGYYIYYERNEAMQDYMVSLREEEEIPVVEEVKDEAIKHFREIIRERKEESNQKKMMNFMYATSTFLVMIVVAIGITMINNYDKMRDMEEALSTISNAIALENDEDGWTLSEEESQVNQENQEAAGQSETIPVQKVDGEVKKEDSTSGTEQQDQNQSSEAQTSEQQEAVQQTENQQAQDASTTEDSVSQSDATQSSTAENPDQVVQENSESVDTSEAVDSTAAQVSAEPTTYVVQVGDTLVSISEKFYGTKDMVSQICTINGIENSDEIMIGQNLILP